MRAGAKCARSFRASSEDTEVSVVCTDISVHTQRVVGTESEVMTAVVAAVADAHSASALLRALTAVLTAHLPVVEVAVVGLGAPARDETGRMVELAPGVTVRLRSRARLPAFCAAPGFRSLLAEVVRLAQRHLEVVQRVAAVSQRAHVANRTLRDDLDRAAPSSLIARSPAMRGVLERVALVARHPTTVLLTGESGTGKEVLARELHRRSSRVNRPLLQLNCGAIPEALVESELFGHERGAFTGAERARAGLFERAHRSTLLLDEVGELSLAAQVKLLRVLQERRVRRVGGSEEIEVDVRLIAATNRPLAAMVRDGRFRADLYYRLDVFAIAVPPLRERPEDLAPLVSAIVGEHAARLGLPTPPIPRAALAQLMAHPWPGNVRELVNVLEAALVLGGGHSLELPAGFASTPRGAGLALFDAASRDTIEAALRATRGRLYGPAGAAARLGLRPTTLQSKMRRLGIDRARFA